MASRKVLLLGLAGLVAGLASCAKKPDLESEFRPILLHWSSLSPEAEEHEQKDACVIRVTSQLMREPLVLKSKVEDLSYNAYYGLDAGSLVVEGFEADSTQRGMPEYHWTATCDDGEKVVVKFHNGQ